MAEITMSIQEYEELKTQRDTAEARAAAMEAKAAAAELSDPDDIIVKLMDAIDAALPIIKFAAGNLDPRTVRGWPYPELETFAKTLDTLPGADIATKDTALEFRNFILEGQATEAERYSGDASKFGGNVTLTLVFADEQARSIFMDTNEITLPGGLGEIRRRYFVCSFEQAVH